MRYRVLGGLLGLFVGGPIGAVIGFWLGSRVDRKRRQRQELVDALGVGPDAVAAAVVGLAAKLAKADGQVSVDEIRAFKRVFHVPAEDDRKIADLWHQARQHASGYEPYARQLALTYRHQPMMLEQIYIALEQIAHADGQLTPDEQDMLRTVADIFNLRDLAFAAETGGAASPAAPDAVNLDQARHALDGLFASGSADDSVIDRFEQTDVRLSESLIRRDQGTMSDPLVKMAVAGVVGAAAFLLVRDVALWPWAFPYSEIVLNLIPALAAAGLVYLMLPRRRSLREELAGVAKQGALNVDDMVEAIEAARGRINAIKRIADRLDVGIGKRLHAICAIAERIVDGFRADPEDFRRSRRVLGHYLIATEDLAKRYAELAGRGPGNARAQDVIGKFEPVLMEIEDLFQRQYARNFDNEARKLDIDIDVLRQTIKAEAL